MPKDKTVTHIKVLAAAREEFMEYGYENASMRRIGQRCDMTAAGLYRHCKDKAGLFGELVSPSIEKIDAWLEAHINRSIQTMENETIDLWKDSEIDMMRDLIYPNMEEYRLLLSAYTTALFEPVIHGYSKEEAYRCSEMLEEFFLPGWKQLLGF